MVIVHYTCTISKVTHLFHFRLYVITISLFLFYVNRKKDVALYLLKCDADVNIQAKNGCTAFDMASLIDDVDTDLLRLLAAKAMAVNKVDKSKKHWPKQNGMTPPIQADPGLDDQPKSGLKPNKRMNNYVDPVQTTSSITSYETMWLETQKSASMYTLDLNPVSSTLKSETLKPVIPPFLPQPSFALDGPNHPRKPVSARNPSLDNSMPSPVRQIKKPVMFLPSNKSTSNLSSSPVSPSSSARFTNGGSNPSPASSGEYNGNNVFLVNPNLPVPSKPASSTSPFIPPHTPSRLFMPRKPSSVPLAFRTASNTTSPNSSTSGSSSITPQRSHGRSTSSKGSTTSTLTPSPSPTPGKVCILYICSYYTNTHTHTITNTRESLYATLFIILHQHMPLPSQIPDPLFTLKNINMHSITIGREGLFTVYMFTIIHQHSHYYQGGSVHWYMFTMIHQHSRYYQGLSVHCVYVHYYTSTLTLLPGVVCSLCICSLLYINTHAITKEGLFTGICSLLYINTHAITKEGLFTDELSGILKKLSLEKYQPMFEEQEGKERQQFLDTMTSFQSTLKARVPSEAGRSLVEALNIRQVHDPTVPGSKSRSS
ncbi:hypothetical protein KUTeg_018980 [Tegillarca granosa]|uniref:Uncharacterized protein n=1 Tax=Tegillarca granosa TaxID=220873 RepID=A0ABQ9EB68_TEGGR|nr:hypothetical protein KUTeg_018980 [Tegillarca granosa]